MTNGIRRPSLYGISGVLLAIVIISGFVLANSFILPAKGTLTILITDKPVELEELNLTIDEVRIKGENEEWTTLTLIDQDETTEEIEPFYFNLLALQDISEKLSETSINSGNYIMITMHVVSAQAVYVGGETEELTVPSDVIKVLLKPHLSLEAGGQITVLIDLQPEDLQSIAISQSLNLRPVIKAVVTS